MKRLRVSEISGFVESCYSNALNTKQMKLDNGSDISPRESPTTSDDSSKKEGVRGGILVAGGDSTDEEGERSEKSLSYGLISLTTSDNSSDKEVVSDGILVAGGDSTDEEGERSAKNLSHGLISPSTSDNSSEKEGVSDGILEAEGDTTDEEGERSAKSLSHGLISVIGRRRVMEDAVTVAIGDIKGYDFFAVYDGHGGAQTANSCRERLHLIIAEEMNGRKSSRRGGFEYWEKLMTACFAKMDEEVSYVDQQVPAAAAAAAAAAAMKSMGSTALVVMVGKDELVVANCGDSRAVLSRGGVAVALSRDHKPDRPDEKERVEAAGGRVINWNGSRVLGVLATSRSIGDQYLKPYVISEPEVTVTERTKLDNFLIIGSDGLWDVVSNEFACEVVRRCLSGQLRMRFSGECNGSSAAEAAALLAELAMARGSKDNISVIVVVLKNSGKISRS